MTSLRGVPRVAEIPREEFLAHHFWYELGEHALFLETTQQGKTHLAYQMLDRAMGQHPHAAAVSLMPKAKSPATWAWAIRLELKVLEAWPPPKPIWKEPPRGHVLWPKHLAAADTAANRAHLAASFRKCLTDRFRAGNSIIFADDVYNLAVLLGLNPDLEEIWTAGAEGGAGLWATAQKPSGTREGGSVSSFALNSWTHLVLGWDTDVRNVRRVAEISGGIDPDVVAAIVPGLRKYPIKTPYGVKNISEKLYIHKGGPYMCRIGP